MIPEFARLLVLNDHAAPFGVHLNPALADAMARRLSPPAGNVAPLPVRHASSGPACQSATDAALERDGVVRLDHRRPPARHANRCVDISE